MRSYQMTGDAVSCSPFSSHNINTHGPTTHRHQNYRDQVLLVLIRVWVTIHKTISDLWLCLSVSYDTAIRPCNTPHPPSSTPHTPSPRRRGPPNRSPKLPRPVVGSPQDSCAHLSSRPLVFSHPQTRYIPIHPFNSSTRPPYPDISSPSAVHLLPIRIVVVVHPSVRPGRILNRS